MKYTHITEIVHISGYEPTPNDGLQLGIITCMFFDFLEVKFKYMAKKEGPQKYLGTASIMKTINNVRLFDNCVVIDSNKVKRDLEAYAHDFVLNCGSPSALKDPNPSSFGNATAQPIQDELPF